MKDLLAAVAFSVALVTLSCVSPSKPDAPPLPVTPATPRTVQRIVEPRPMLCAGTLDFEIAERGRRAPLDRNAPLYVGVEYESRIGPGPAYFGVELSGDLLQGTHWGTFDSSGFATVGLRLVGLGTTSLHARGGEGQCSDLRLIEVRGTEPEASSAEANQP